MSMDVKSAIDRAYDDDRFIVEKNSDSGFFLDMHEETGTFDLVISNQKLRGTPRVVFGIWSKFCLALSAVTCAIAGWVLWRSSSLNKSIADYGTWDYASAAIAIPTGVLAFLIAGFLIYFLASVIMYAPLSYHRRDDLYVVARGMVVDDVLRGEKWLVTYPDTMTSFDITYYACKQLVDYVKNDTENTHEVKKEFPEQALELIQNIHDIYVSSGSELSVDDQERVLRLQREFARRINKEYARR